MKSATTGDEHPAPILAIVGPTASGKSQAALQLAMVLGGEIVSADSMQLYRGMDIGTAKPTAGERARVPHHLLDLADPGEPFSAARYACEARQAIRDIQERHRLPILCGGTGLYLSTLLEGRLYVEGTRDPVLRANLESEWNETDGETLRQRLLELDPDAAARFHPNDRKRIIRTLEQVLLTGSTLGDIHARSRTGRPLAGVRVFGIDWPRPLLVLRIRQRVDNMMQNGLVEEVRQLVGRSPDCLRGPSSTARQAIGYKELLPFLDGIESLDACVDRIRTATCQYAKRQMTWFRSMPAIEWIRPKDAQHGFFEHEIVETILARW